MRSTISNRSVLALPDDPLGFGTGKYAIPNTYATMGKPAAERRRSRRAKEDEYARHLITIPGICPVVATVIIALAPPIETFRTKETAER